MPAAPPRPAQPVPIITGRSQHQDGEQVGDLVAGGAITPGGGGCWVRVDGQPALRPDPCGQQLGRCGGTVWWLEGLGAPNGQHRGHPLGLQADAQARGCRRRPHRVPARAGIGSCSSMAGDGGPDDRAWSRRQPVPQLRVEAGRRGLLRRRGGPRPGAEPGGIRCAVGCALIIPNHRSHSANGHDEVAPEPACRPARGAGRHTQPVMGGIAGRDPVQPCCSRTYGHRTDWGDHDAQRPHHHPPPGPGP
jgi:hypothetical protein